MDIEQLLAQRASLVMEKCQTCYGYQTSGIAELSVMHIIKRKRIRPALVTLASEAVGGQPIKLLCSGFIELIHSSSLVLDDVIDKSEKDAADPLSIPYGALIWLYLPYRSSQHFHSGSARDPAYTCHCRFTVLYG